MPTLTTTKLRRPSSTKPAAPKPTVMASRVRKPSTTTSSIPPPSTQPRKTAKGVAAANWRRYTGALASPTQTPIAATSPSLSALRARIRADATLTPFRRRVYLLLTQVPRGEWTTYKALAAAADGGSARAVGGAMRSNPFAPAVPCHRVMAADGKIGGFKGGWGEEGEFAGEKERLLREEGVVFDGSRKVKGTPWVGFTAVV